ncbi:ComC/BlpC family leader-containing pheromone/bacteriocin [Neisseria wadsworthii]|uniref:ComC/BlpC family leader-containing pheromone/bacteriocin n=1 Tax=Neisseria wadsworthii TaxID=607711 RepID=UPI000D30784D|nr:ComC/BlpC family leader-containing pheromone/bacteriocin [Neisseria wadsworthii]
MQTLKTHELEQVSGGFIWNPSCSFISTLANFLKAVDPQVSLLPTKIAIEMASDRCSPHF